MLKKHVFSITVKMIMIFSFICIIPSELLSANFSGHRLPWMYLDSIKVTQKDGGGHENQIDFALGADVYASKPGTVVFVKESSNESCTLPPPNLCWQKANVVVIQHSDSEYSWYYHLQNNSVPVSVGESVGYGTKIGVTGQTGYSFGIHLHFMASTGYSPPSDPNNAPWPTGVITPVDFDEVKWSNITSNSSYISQNCSSSNQTSWEFNTNGGYECWTFSNMESFSVNSGALFIDSAASDPYITSPTIAVSASSYNTIQFRMASNAPDGIGNIYFITTADKVYTESKKVIFTVKNEPGGHANWYEYSIYMGDNQNWNGTITGIRIDPANTGILGTGTDTIGFDYIRLSYSSPTTVNMALSRESFDDYGTVQVGQSSDKAIIIQNGSISNANLTGGVSISGTGFSIVQGNGSFNLAPGAATTVMVRFSPTSQGAASGTFTITHNATSTTSPITMSLSGSGQTPTCDTIPDSFTFTDQTGVALSTAATSNQITVSGMTCAASISITGGTYSINGGAYTNATGTVYPIGDTVTVRQTSSGSYSTKTDAVLTIGGVSDTFSVTTFTETALIKGDINNDTRVDLSDAILAMQVIAGLTSVQPATQNADVDGNGKIGMAEAIYILQVVSGMRATAPSEGATTTLVSGLSAPWEITTDGNDLYFTEGNTVKKVSVSGGSITTLVNNLNQPRGIVLRNQMVYWTEFNGFSVKSIPTSGGSITTIASGLDNNPDRLVIYDNYLYTHGTTLVPLTKIWKINISGGGTVTLADGIKAPRGIAVDGNYVYFTEYPTGSVKKVPIGGGTAITLASGLNSPWGVAVNNGFVYFTDADAKILYKVAVDGGPLVPLSVGLSNPITVIVDGSYVYVAEYMSGGTAKKIPINGGTAIALDNDRQGAYGLVTDSLFIYWTEPFTGKIKKSPK